MVARSVQKVAKFLGVANNVNKRLLICLISTPFERHFPPAWVLVYQEYALMRALFQIKGTKLLLKF